MSDVISLDWSPVNWEDPDGGIVRILPFSPLVDFSESFGEWHGLALMASSEEPQLWNEQYEEDRESPNIVRDAMIAQMGHSGRMVKEMAFLEHESIGKFPDPIPFKSFQLAIKTDNPVWFLEPDMDDENWVKLTLDGVDQRASIWNLIRSIGSGRKMMRIARTIAKSTSPRSDNLQIHIASSLSAAWWIIETNHLTEDLHMRINHRIASRIRGSLRSLCEFHNGQIDVEKSVVLLVPVPLVRLQGVLAALDTLPDTEEMKQEEE